MPALQKRIEVAQPLHTNYRLIPLTQGQFAKVDAEDFVRISKLNWYAGWSKIHKSFHARHSLTGGGCILMSRFVLSYKGRLHVDHRNHDTLDNRKDNLRICSRTQNSRNIRKQSYKGIHRRKENGRYRAMIRVNKHLKHLGHYGTAEEAARAYDKAAKKYFQKFACLNFPT